MSIRVAQRSLNLLHQNGKAHRIPYFDISHDFGGRTWVYNLNPEKHVRTMDHELAITDYHIKLKQFCHTNGFRLTWQQKGMKKFIRPDAYFSFDGLHFFLEIERQDFGNVKDGKPSILRKAERYYAYYNTEQCQKDWGFKLFRVIFQIQNQLRAEKLLNALAPITHRMFWVGTPGTQRYRTPTDYTERAYSFHDI